MKKSVFILLLSVVCCFTLPAQVSYDCNEDRFLKEVFSGHTFHTGIPYGENYTLKGSFKELKMDIYEPENDTLPVRPLIIFAHGGYFVGGDRSDNHSICRDFADRGYVTATIDYRKWGSITMVPDSFEYTSLVIRAVGDMKAAVRFFKKDFSTTNTYRVDTSNIFVSGYSAGGFMSLYSAYLDDLAEVPQWIAGTIMANGGIEGSTGNEGYSSRVKGCINMAGALYNANIMDSNDPPYLMSIHGDQDEVVPYKRGYVRDPFGGKVVKVDGSFILHERAELLGFNNTLHTAVGAGHGINNYQDSVRIFLTNFLGSVICEQSTGFPEEEIDKSRFSIFPNPAGEMIIISSTIIGPFDIGVFDLSGQLLIRKQTEKRIDISGLCKGVYIIHIMAGGRTLREVFVKY